MFLFSCVENGSANRYVLCTCSSGVFLCLTCFTLHLFLLASKQEIFVLFLINLIFADNVWTLYMFTVILEKCIFIHSN